MVSPPKINLAINTTIVVADVLIALLNVEFNALSTGQWLSIPFIITRFYFILKQKKQHKYYCDWANIAITPTTIRTNRIKKNIFQNEYGRSPEIVPFSPFTKK